MTRTATALCLATHRRDPDRPRPAADGLNLCHGCHKGLDRNLADLPTLAVDVEDSLPSGCTSTGPTVSGSRTPRLPYNPRAGNLLSQVRHDLVHLVHRVLDERGLTAGPAPHVTAMCAWLRKHVHWLAAHPDAGVYRDILAELVGRCWGVLDPARAPLAIGPCAETVDGQTCDGYLWVAIRRDGDTAPSVIWCDTCTLELDTTQWHRFGRRYTARLERISA